MANHRRGSTFGLGAWQSGLSLYRLLGTKAQRVLAAARLISFHGNILELLTEQALALWDLKAAVDSTSWRKRQRLQGFRNLQPATPPTPTTVFSHAQKPPSACPTSGRGVAGGSRQACCSGGSTSKPFSSDFRATTWTWKKLEDTPCPVRHVCF